MSLPKNPHRIPANLRGLFRAADSPRTDTRCRATGEKRKVNRGEWYLSGAVIEGYKAPNDLDQEFWIAELVKVTERRCECCGGTGREIIAVEKIQQERRNET